ncbi:MAG: tyrosine recombinase [Oscillospiraceae bacterium]|jgi:integrase/recombinase XerD|nr:tyrosine recombinase [Oscillospiraceae bacterium]
MVSALPRSARCDELGGETTLFDKTDIYDYKKHLIDERGLSDNTVSSYIRDITQFADYLFTSGKSDFAGVTEDDVRLFIRQLETKGRSQATISRCIASLRAFFNHTADTGYMMRNPAAGISPVSSAKKPPRILSGDEIKRLLEQPVVSGAKGYRDKAMLETLYATGLRVSELVALDESDANLTTNLIVCRNGKERIIPIYAEAVRAIGNYLSFARGMMADPGEHALFVNANGKRMTRQGLWKILKSYAEKAHISVDINPQILRNSFAAHLLENGADLQSLQEMLGHTDIASTQVFARAVKKHLKDVYKKAHPRA